MKLGGGTIIGAVLVVLAGLAGWFFLSRDDQGLVQDAPSAAGPADGQGTVIVQQNNEQDAPSSTEAPENDTVGASGDGSNETETPAATAGPVGSAPSGQTETDQSTTDADNADPAASEDTTGNDTRAASGQVGAEQPADAAADETQTAALDPTAGEQAAGDPARSGNNQSESDTAETTSQPVNPDAPRFDVVRVDSDGQTVIAGQAAPNSNVEILLDGEVVGDVQTDANGAFVTVIFADLTGSAQNLIARVPAPDAGLRGGAGETAGAATSASEAPLALNDDGSETVGGDAQSGGGVSGTDTPETTAVDGQPGSGATGDAANLTRENSATSSSGDSSGTAANPSQTEDSSEIGSAALAAGGATDPSGGAAAPSLSQNETLPGDGDLSPLVEQPPSLLSGNVGGADQTSLSTPSPQDEEIARSGASAETLTGGGGSLPDAAPRFSSSNAANDFLTSAPVVILPSQNAEDAPVLVEARPEGLTVVQPAQTEVQGVVLDQITYGETGEVKLAGRGQPGRAIRIYGNGRAISTVRVAENGTWRLTVSEATGRNLKLLRMDELSGTGQVTSRIEAPFEYSRLSPQVVRDRRVVIQRGDMLWRIAEQFYGEGLRYSLIYGANTGLIRDPDLIYPGQVFTIPELVDAAQ
ncbi:MAG: LysM peptidoglycan-binding domain-containing protein [Pseudomonadota bacterium]